MTLRRLFALIAFAALLRLPLLFSQLWYDENYTLILSRLPFDQMVQAINGDVHPPLFYLLEWLPYRLPLPPFAIRVIPYLASLACLPVFARVLEYFGLGEKVKTAALVLMAIAPMQVFYASEGRMYSLLCLLYLCGVWAVFNMRWPLVFIVSTDLVYLHNWGLFYAFTLGALALYLWRSRAWWGWKSPYSRRELRNILAAFGASALAWLPWALFVLRGQMTGIHENYWIIRVTPGQIVYQIYQQLFASTLPLPTALVVTLAWLLAGIYWQRRNAPLLLLAFLPVALAVVVSVTWQPVLLFRALIGVSPFLYILYASMVETVTTPRRALLAACYLLPLFIMAFGVIYVSPYRDGKLEYLDAIRPHYQPGDVIATQDDTAVVNLLPYTDIPIIMVPECRPALGALSNQTRRAMGYTMLAWDYIPARRVWWIGGRSPLMPQCQADLTAKLTAGVSPVFVEASDSDLIYSALWLLEK